MKVNPNRKVNNNTENHELNDIAKKIVTDIIDELKHSTIAKEFEGTNVYVKNPERIFSAKNFKLDSIKCAIFDTDRKFVTGNIRCCDIFMAAFCGEANIITFDNDKLMFFTPGSFQDEPPTVIFDCNEDNSQIEIFGEIMVIGFDWKSNSFRNISSKDLEKLKTMTY